MSVKVVVALLRGVMKLNDYRVSFDWFYSPATTTIVDPAAARDM
jgi:hypothetical protein